MELSNVISNYVPKFGNLENFTSGIPNLDTSFNEDIFSGTNLSQTSHESHSFSKETHTSSIDGSTTSTSVITETSDVDGEVDSGTAVVQSYSEGTDTSISITADSNNLLNYIVPRIFSTDNNVTRFSGVNSNDTMTITFKLNLNFGDIVFGYNYFNKNGYEYLINGRDSGFSMQHTSKNSVEYSTNTFFDVGNKNGYLSNFTNNNGVMNFVDANISGFSRQNDYVNFTMGNGTSFQAQTSGSVDDIFQYSVDGQNVAYAKLGFENVGNTFTYEDNVSYIGNIDQEDTVSLTADDSKTINLGSENYINVDNVDARNSQGVNQLIGNTGNNKLYAGANDSLWGGIGGDDELYASGSGNNTFYYGVNEGNTIVYNSGASDKINLYNISLTDIASAGEIGENFVINTTGGDSLTITGQDGASNFSLSDGSSYKYDRETHTWSIPE